LGVDSLMSIIRDISVAPLQVLKYYQADDVNLGFESELKFLSNG